MPTTRLGLPRTPEGIVKLAELRENSPFCHGFLVRAMMEGRTTAEVASWIAKSAAEHPEVAQAWEELMGKDADGFDLSTATTAPRPTGSLMNPVPNVKAPLPPSVPPPTTSSWTDSPAFKAVGALAPSEPGGPRTLTAPPTVPQSGRLPMARLDDPSKPPTYQELLKRHEQTPPLQIQQGVAQGLTKLAPALNPGKNTNTYGLDVANELPLDHLRKIHAWQQYWEGQRRHPDYQASQRLPGMLTGDPNALSPEDAMKRQFVEKQIADQRAALTAKHPGVAADQLRQYAPHLHGDFSAFTPHLQGSKLTFMPTDATLARHLHQGIGDAVDHQPETGSYAARPLPSWDLKLPRSPEEAMQWQQYWGNKPINPATNTGGGGLKETTGHDAAQIYMAATGLPGLARAGLGMAAAGGRAALGAGRSLLGRGAAEAAETALPAAAAGGTRVLPGAAEAAVPGGATRALPEASGAWPSMVNGRNTMAPAARETVVGGTTGPTMKVPALAELQVQHETALKGLEEAKRKAFDLARPTEAVRDGQGLLAAQKQLREVEEAIARATGTAKPAPAQQIGTPVEGEFSFGSSGNVGASQRPVTGDPTRPLTPVNPPAPETAGTKTIAGQPKPLGQTQMLGNDISSTDVTRYKTVAGKAAPEAAAAQPLGQTSVVPPGPKPAVEPPTIGQAPPLQAAAPEAAAASAQAGQVGGAMERLKGLIGDAAKTPGIQQNWAGAATSSSRPLWQAARDTAANAAGYLGQGSKWVGEHLPAGWLRNSLAPRIADTPGWPGTLARGANTILPRAFRMVSHEGALSNLMAGNFGRATAYGLPSIGVTALAANMRGEKHEPELSSLLAPALSVPISLGKSIGIPGLEGAPGSPNIFSDIGGRMRDWAQVGSGAIDAMHNPLAYERAQTALGLTGQSAINAIKGIGQDSLRSGNVPAMSPSDRRQLNDIDRTGLVVERQKVMQDRAREIVANPEAYANDPKILADAQRTLAAAQPQQTAMQPPQQQPLPSGQVEQPAVPGQLDVSQQPQASALPVEQLDQKVKELAQQPGFPQEMLQRVQQTVGEAKTVAEQFRQAGGNPDATMVAMAKPDSPESQQGKAKLAQDPGLAGKVKGLPPEQQAKAVEGIWSGLTPQNRMWVYLGLGLTAIALISSLTGGGDDEEGHGGGGGMLSRLAPLLGLGGLAAAGYGATGGDFKQLGQGKFWSGVGHDVGGIFGRR